MDMENHRTNKQFLEVEEDQKSLSSVSLGSGRIGFIRKVYSILSAQLFFTVLVCGLSYASPAIQLFQVSNMSLFFVLVILSIVIQFAILCCQNVAKQVPNNYIALGVFTICEAYIVSTICSSVYLSYGQEGAQIVLAAAFLTLGVTVALTLYACKTKSDFTICGGTLFVCCMVLILFGLLAMVFQSQVLHLLITSASAILFGIYLIYDTQLIAGGKRHELDIDDYIVGALILYIDIIALFLQILQILLELFGNKE